MKFGKINLNYFSRQKVGRQLMTLYICTILVPLLLLGGIIYFISYRQIVRNYVNLSESKARQVQSVLMTTTLYLQDIYNSVSTDTSLRDILSADYENAEAFQAALSGYSGFNDIMKENASLTDLKFYIEGDFSAEDIGSPYICPVTDDIRQSEWYQKASSTHVNFWRTARRTGQYDIPYWELNYYCHIPIPQKSSFGVLVMTMSNDHLRNLIQEDEYDIYISVNDDPVFLSSDRNYVGNSFPAGEEFLSQKQSSGRMDVLGETEIGAVTTLTPYATSDQIHILAASRTAVFYINRLGIVFLVTILFALFISALLIFLYTRYFSSRIQTLRLAMHKVSHNDYEIVNSIQGDDELTATFRDLKTMIRRLKEDEAKIYESQIQEQILRNQQQEIELKLLTSQINPHFLYNTLETIRMKAFSEGNRDVATAIKLLGKSMRYVLNNTKDTSATLDKEIDYIRTYLAIQKMRFGERLNYKIRIDEKLRLCDYQILPLLIQPIVENAISHGLKDLENGGNLILRIKKSGDDLLVADVFDTGAGITPEKLEDVLLHLNVPQPESDHGVGLYNINNRVHLFYGNQYGLTIRSRPGLGTLVTLTIPLLNLTEEE